MLDDVARLIALYDLERYLFEVVTERFKERSTLNPYDFFAIVIWKSNRTKTKIKKGLDADNKTVASLMREVSEATTPKDKVAVLWRIRGIGPAVASAILTVCYPNEFTVLDSRVWETLNQMSVKGLPMRYPCSIEEYLQYCQACQRLADQVGVSLRDLDRALWAKSWEDDLLKLIGA